MPFLPNDSYIGQKPLDNLAETARDAVHHSNAQLLSRLVDILRFQARMNYRQCLSFFQEHAEITEQDFDALLYEAETEGVQP